MAEFGWTVPCLVGEDGELIAGHGRVLAATQLGLTEAPVIVLGHLTEAQRRAYRIADNKLTELGTWDEALLSAELNDLLAEDFDLSLVGFSDGELDKLLAYVAEDDGEEGGAGGSVPPVTIPEPPRNPASRTGDLWILGDHRLLCGDSTSAADVRRLMNGERAILFATDPPYLVDYDGSNHPTRNKDWSRPTARPGTTVRRARSSTTASSPPPWPRPSPRMPPGTAGTPRAARRCSRPAGRRRAPSSISRSSG
jgi:ParB-like chromosome segregation protein Spo0J